MAAAGRRSAFERAAADAAADDSWASEDEGATTPHLDGLAPLATVRAAVEAIDMRGALQRALLVALGEPSAAPDAREGAPTAATAAACARTLEAVALVLPCMERLAKDAVAQIVRLEARKMGAARRMATQAVERTDDAV